MVGRNMVGARSAARFSGAAASSYRPAPISVMPSCMTSSGAVELDPLAPLLVMQLGMTLMGAGRSEEAAAPLKRAAELAPTMFLPTIHLGLLSNHLRRS